jgi:co-chaperonin GroES (HSP10)
MKIKPKQGILVIKKHNQTALKVDIIQVEDEQDKRLITGEVLSDNSKLYTQGDTVIFGKYALYLLTIEGEDFYLLDEEDVIGTTNYKE